MALGNRVFLHHALQRQEHGIVRALTRERAACVVTQRLEPLSRTRVVRRDTMTVILHVDAVVAVAAPRVQHVDAVARGRWQEAGRTREALRALADHVAAVANDGVHQPTGTGAPRS